MHRTGDSSPEAQGLPEERRRSDSGRSDLERSDLERSDLPQSEKPRERLVRCGPRALATAELLAILFGTGRQGASALEVGNEIVARFRIAGLAQASLDELTRVPGCGPAKAIRIKAALELGKRLVTHDSGAPTQLSGPADAARMLSHEMTWLEQEHLRIVLVNVKNHVMGVHEVYKGSVSSSPVRVAEVFREAVRRNCPAIIVAHNHPSGDPSPSSDDVYITTQIVEAGRLLDIDVLDHIIIGRRSWVSLRERGLGFSTNRSPRRRTSGKRAQWRPVP